MHLGQIIQTKQTLVVKIPTKRWKYPSEPVTKKLQYKELHS
jgi:hypothetical protein